MLSRLRLVRLYERLGFRSVAVYGNTRRTTRELPSLSSTQGHARAQDRQRPDVD